MTSTTVSCTCKYGHGSSRSIVRRIGNALPLSTGKRLHIQVTRAASSPQPVHAYCGDVEGLVLASSFKNAGDPISQTLSDPLSSSSSEEGGEMEMEREDLASDDSGMETILEGDEEDGVETVQKQETLEKISALENELARLKAQIAVYALSNVPDIPTAPPPPPLAPPAPPVQHRAPSLTDAVRSEETPISATPNSNFAHVLQDISSVKLRSVPSIVRSPGGTPMRKGQRAREPANNDPAEVIAQALRRKFAHNVFQDSPDKESLNRSSESLTSGFDSPAGKLFK